jgi:hypothetical protein
MANNSSNTNTINSNENTPAQSATIRRMEQIFQHQYDSTVGNTGNIGNTDSNRISNADLNRLMINSNSSNLSEVSAPLTAPTRCYDPILATEMNINNQNTIFYIANQNGIIQTASCLDEESLNEYKSRDEYIFFRCRDGLPRYAVGLRANDIKPGSLRLLNFSMRIYVKDSQAQQLQPGKRYLLTPIGDVGRIVSFTYLRAVRAISSSHCSPSDGSQLYKIEEIRLTTGGHKRRRHKSYPKKTKIIRRLRAKNYTRKQKGALKHK